MATLASNTWLSLADTKEYLGISSGDTDNDDLIINMINRATTLVETYLDRVILTATYTNEVYEGTGSPYLFLRQYPVTALTSIDYRTENYQSSYETLDTTEYDYRADNGVVRRNANFRSVPAEYRVTYTAGYAAASVPQDLSLAVLDLISYLWNQRKSKGIQSERLGEYSVTWFEGARSIRESGAFAILEPYRRINVAGL